MCGLFGRFSSFVLVRDDTRDFVNLQYVSMTRGTDAFGVCSISNGATPGDIDYSFVKGAMNPGTAPGYTEYHKVVNPLGKKAILGHVRAATRGDAKNSLNAHPFLSKDKRFLMFHNGTLLDYQTDYETDSEWLCNRIADNDGDIKTALKNVHGAWAIVLLDTKKKTLTFFRNKERTLFIANKPHEWAYASESWMLTGVFGPSVKPELLEENIAVEFSFVAQAQTTKLVETRRYSVKPETFFSGFRSGGTAFGANKTSGYWDNKTGEFVSNENSNEGPPESYVEREPNKKGSSPRTIGETNIVPFKGSAKVVTKELNKFEFIDLDGCVFGLTRASSVFPCAGSTRVTLGTLLSLGLTLKECSVLMVINENFKLMKATGTNNWDVEVETTAGSWLDLRDFIDLVEHQASLKAETAFWMDREWVDHFEFRNLNKKGVHQ